MNKQIIVRHQNVGFNFSFQQGALVLNCLLTYLCGGWGARQIPEPRCMSRQRAHCGQIIQNHPYFIYRNSVLVSNLEKIFKIANNEKSLQPFFW